MKIADDGSRVADLVARLSANRLPARAAAADAIADLAADQPETIGAIVAAGAIAPLVKLLRGGARTQAAVALSDIAVPHGEAIAAAGAIPPLVDMLGSAEPPEQYAAAMAVSNLNYHPPNSRALAEAGAVPKLVELLVGTEPVVRATAATALRNLTSFRPNLKRIEAAGAIPRLVEMLGIAEEGAHAKAASVLANLAYLPELRGAVVAAGAIPPLVEMLSSPDACVQFHAASALTNASQSPDGCRAIEEAGGVPRLVRMLDSADDAHRRIQAAARTLAGLARCREEARPIVAAAGAVPTLLRLAADDDGDVAMSAVTALHFLAMHEPTGRAIERAGGVEVLMGLLRHASDVRAEAALTLTALAVDSEAVAKAVAGSPEPLVEMLGSERVAVGATAAMLLSELATFPDLRVAVSDSRIIEGLLGLLRCPREDPHAPVAIHHAHVTIHRLARARPDLVTPACTR